MYTVAVDILFFPLRNDIFIPSIIAGGRWSCFMHLLHHKLYYILFIEARGERKSAAATADILPLLKYIHSFLIHVLIWTCFNNLLHHKLYYVSFLEDARRKKVRCSCWLSSSSEIYSFLYMYWFLHVSTIYQTIICQWNIKQFNNCTILHIFYCSTKPAFSPPPPAPPRQDGKISICS